MNQRRVRQAAAFIFLPQISAGRALEPVWSAFVMLIRGILIQAALLPREHAGGLSNTLRDAGSAVQWTRAGVPGATIYVAVIAMLATACIGSWLALLHSFLGTAHAQTVISSLSDLTGNQDLSNKWLVAIFGVSSGGAAQVQNVVGEMLLVYNAAAGSIASFLTIWTIVAFMLDSGHHGEVGGRRHNLLWMPIRLTVAASLMIPVPGQRGWNGGELSVIWLAAQGAKVATAMWSAAGEVMAKGGVIVTPQPSQKMEAAIGATLQTEVCKLAFNAMAQRAGQPDYIAVNVSRQLKVPGSSTVVAVERSYDGAYTYPRKACGAQRFVPPENIPEAGAQALVAAHRDVFVQTLPEIQTLAAKIVAAQGPNSAAAGPMPPTADAQTIVEKYSADVIAAIGPAVGAQNGVAQSALSTDIKSAGWLLAPVWLNTMARLNGQILDAAEKVPEVAGPAIMDSWPDEVKRPLAASEVYWHAALTDAGRPTTSSTSAGESESFLDHYIAKLGLQTVIEGFEITGNNPMAELSALGHKILDWSFAAMLAIAAIIVAAKSPLLNIATAGLGEGISAGLIFLGPLLTCIFGMLGIAGITLAYVLPFIPTIRWVYGCVAWVLALAEAVLAIPVMLIAHIRSDGDGIAGSAGAPGYTILLSLFLRPPAMIFGLITGLLIFTNIIKLWNWLFLPTITSVQGGSAIGLVSVVVHVVLYTTVSYGIANASFKAVDQLPDQLARWIGGAMTQTPTEGINQAETNVQKAGEIIGTAPGAPRSSGAGAVGFGENRSSSDDRRTEDMLPR